jgi:peptidoglycan/LPS O-acetylase OafA/YrhL
MAMLATGADPARFVLHRVVRIYPIYLIVVCSLVVAKFLLFSRGNTDLWALGLVAGGPRQYSLGTEWTLPFEITFYVIIVALMLANLGKAAPMIGALWIGAIIFVHHEWPDLQGSQQFPALLRIPVSTSTLGFAAGMLIPRFVHLKGVLIVSAIIGAIAAAASQIDSAHQDWWFIVVSTSLVTAALTPQAIRSRPILPLGKLGDWSYAIYLCHVPIVTAIVQLSPGDWPSVPLWIAAIIGAIGFSSVVGMLDLRLYAFLRRWVDGSSVGLRRSLSIAFVAIYVSVGIAWMLRPS